MRKVPCENCAIRDAACIVDLPTDKLDAFHECGATAIYRGRQVVFHEGEPADGLYILCVGAVKLYQSDRFGREYILDVASPGDVLGELPLEPGEPYSVSAEALTESQLCYLPRARLLEFIQIHPMTGVRLVAALSKALASARRKARDLALKGAEGRLADLLMRLVRGEGAGVNGGAQITLSYSRRDLAEMIGVSPETAIRLLSALKRRGVIALEGRQIIVSDVEKLLRLAQRGDIDSG